MDAQKLGHRVGGPEGSEPTSNPRNAFILAPIQQWRFGMRTLVVLMVAISLSAEVASQCKVGQFVPSDNVQGDAFGSSISISGDFLAVGARFDEPFGSFDAGTVYIYERSGFGWSQLAKLSANDGANDDEFGAAVSISAKTVLVGAPRDDDFGSSSGSAYVFEFSGSGSTASVQTAKLVASDAGFGDMFGWTVSLSGGVAIVGSPNDDDAGSDSGSVYVFEATPLGWLQMAKLSASDAAQGDNFGSSVFLAGDTIVVGAPGDDDGGENSGSAYVFVDSPAGFVEVTKLTASDSSMSASFGAVVAVSKTDILVGAPHEDRADPPNGGCNSGAAYVFDRTHAGFPQIGKLTPSDSECSRSFGLSAAIRGEFALVGARRVPGSNPGSAYVFQRAPGGFFFEAAKLTEGGVASPGGFGEALTLDASAALVTEPNNTGSIGGSFYVTSLINLGDPLSGCPLQVSASAGGTQSLNIHAGSALAGSISLMLGSLSGTEPGFLAGGFSVPLNPDAYFSLVLNNLNNPPPLTNSFAPLDVNGKGTTLFKLPAGSNPALVGLTVNHAYGVFEPSTFVLVFVSNPSVLLVVP